jgi:rhodanese-related sulfurtransferase
MKNLKRLFAFAALVLTASLAFAADGDAPKEKYVDPKPWTHKTERLTRPQLDKLLGHPEKLLFIDVRRPDEISKGGGFPIYLSIQTKDLEESLAYIPKGRQIVTISVRAHRAGDAGDFLISKGYKVAGAVGVKDYEDQGGSLTKVAIPAPKVTVADSTPAVEKK